MSRFHYSDHPGKFPTDPNQASRTAMMRAARAAHPEPATPSEAVTRTLAKTAAHLSDAERTGFLLTVGQIRALPEVSEL